MAVLKRIATNSIASVVCDPPYELGFMGKSWDSTGISNSVELWREVLRVLKPGGHLVAFSGTRTYHRMASAIADAGFDVLDMLAWLYGSGFPKSPTLLKPALEPICLARKALSEKTVAANVLRWGTGALNIDGCRVLTEETLNGGAHTGSERGRSEQNQFEGGVLRSGIGPYVQPAGRWPANIIHDGSDEVVAAFPDAKGMSGGGRREGLPVRDGVMFNSIGNKGTSIARNDSGSAARFFYSAKASKYDRAGSNHSTVKPVDVKRWLVRLVTPPHGTVLDPFAGTGTTGEAAVNYQTDIRRRMARLAKGENNAASKKATRKPAVLERG